jgi:hypothetical protein
MSPARIPDDDSLRAPLFPIVVGPPKCPAPMQERPKCPAPKEEPSKSAPASGKGNELRPRQSTEAPHPFEEDGR